jgi:glutamate synthase domain-containing protein 3
MALQPARFRSQALTEAVMKVKDSLTTEELQQFIKQWIRQRDLQLAHQRQQQLLQRWKTRQQKVWKQLMAENHSLEPLEKEKLAEEEKAYEILRTAPLGSLLSSSSGLGQQRRSNRVMNFLTAEEQQALLTTKIIQSQQQKQTK